MIMNNSLTVALLILFFLAHLYVNIRLTADVIGWVPEALRRKAYLLLVWLLPLAGAFYVYRRLAPDWFKPDGDSGDVQSATAVGLIGLDAIFNPSTRNIIEADKKGEITIKAEGEMYDRDLPEFIDVEVARNQMANDDNKLG
jgi:hypothetical protein